MGCGNSTLAAEDADIQARVRPMIKRCIDDVKRRQGFLKDPTLSKKELLAGEDCDKMSNNNESLGRKRMPSEDSIEHTAAKIVPVVVGEEEEEEEAEIIVTSPKKNEDSREEGQQEKEKEKTARAVEENIGGDESELEEEDEGRCISLGSPSFRVYCVESIPHDTEEDDHESHVDDSLKQNLETKNMEEHQASAESAVKDSATRNTKRTINRKLRRAMHKGGQVKSLLRVRSCYNPACSAHDKAHLLQEAAA